MRTISMVSAVLTVAAGLSLAVPALAADGPDKDGKSHRQQHQKPSGIARPAQSAPRHIAVPSAAPARIAAPVKQPVIRMPQSAPAQIVRVPQADRSRQLARRDGGDRRFEGPRRSDGDGRRQVNRYGGHRRLALGAGIVIIGGILGYEAYRGRDRDDVFERCDRNFPDFDYDSGSFENEDGDREICPYLLD